MARCPGFGHPLYPDGDPRARCLLDLLAPLLGTRDTRLVDETLAAAAITSPQAPNVDFALAALAFSAGMSADAIEAIFALARIAGWIAHALEEYAETPLRFRTRAIYVGRPDSCLARLNTPTAVQTGRPEGQIRSGRSVLSSRALSWRTRRRSSAARSLTSRR